MIVLERQWNPGKEEQFEARIDRFGQKEPTVADYLVAKTTVDEDFSAMVEEKRRICGGTIDKDFDFEMNAELLSLLGERAATRRL
jgi:SNF2 family DNA or RNA helicase